MRRAPEGYVPALRVQWMACVMHDILGLKRLKEAPALLSGYRSITRHPALRAARKAIRNLRLIGVNIESEAHLQEAIIEARAWEEDHSSNDDYVEPPFDISTDPGTGFAIRERVRSNDLRRQAMLEALLGELSHDEHGRTAADVSRRFRFRVDGESGPDVICDTRELQGLPLAPAIAPDKKDRAPIAVTIEDLEQVARTLDKEDVSDPTRVPRNFLKRLRSEGRAVFSVLSPQGSSLKGTDTISLDGVSHMIGLPGAGKSTLIFLLVVYLARQGRRVTLLVPSIEFALALDADLARYEVPTALLVGQSPDARKRHATRLAERIATLDSGGFGQTAPGAELLGTQCALSAFVSVPPPGFDYPHQQPPCSSIRQAVLKKDGKEGKEVERLCPLATACGRQRSSRRLADAEALVHIGHVISTEVALSPHFHTEKMRQFERVARTSDLVIIDEVDGAQAALDDKGFAELHLFGSTDSYESILLDDVYDPVASGRGFALSNSIENYTLASNRFMRLNRALRAHLLERMAEERGVLARFENAFVTGNSILASMYLDPGADEDEPGNRRFDLIRKLFDQLVRSVLAGDTGGDGEDDLQEKLDLDRVARDLKIDPTALTSATVRFRMALTTLLNARLVERFEENYDEMRAAFFGVLPPRADLDPQEARILFRFLVEVTTIVLQFLALVPAQYAMIAEGVHTERVFGQGVTADLRRNLPESLIGRLSGIRFANEMNERGQRSLRLQYLSFAGVPRLLLYHLSEMLVEDGIKGPAVLMASATSYLAPSPSYHVPVRPNYVLRREGESEAWRQSVYSFLAVPDPDRQGEFVRVSGAGSERDRNHALRLLTDHFFSGSEPLVHQLRDDQFDPGRRTGIVVNSYDQVAFIKDHLKRTSSSAHRVIGVSADVSKIPASERSQWVSASQVEMLGARDDWDAIVFPMKAIGRGVNIVFTDGDRVRDAVLGNIAFFVRPHPTADSLAFTGGLAGQLALKFDQRAIPANADLAGLAREWRSARDDALEALRWLLRRPQQMSRLGRMIQPFVADGMVDLLQTIGRAMRNGCKTRVFFVDASFAPQSAINRRDTQRTSMIVAMRDVLNSLLSSPDPVEREIYKLLYEPFLHPLRACSNVIFPEMDPE